MIVDGQKISYVSRITNFSKPLTVFLHGWGSSAQAFSLLTQKEENFLAFDFPNCGKSSPLKTVFTLEDYTRLTQKFLEKFLEKNYKKENTPKLSLVGHSFGGRVMLKFLEIFPEKYSPDTIEKLVFIAVPFFRENTFQTRMTGILVKTANTILPEFLKKKFKKIAHLILGENDYFDLDDNEVMKKTFQHIVGEEISGNLPLLKPFPEISVFWGEEDDVIPLSFAYEAQKIIPQIRIFTLSHAGHFPWIGANTQKFLEKWNGKK